MQEQNRMQNDLSKPDNCTIEVVNLDGSVDQSIRAHSPNNMEYFKNLAELAVNSISFGSNLAFGKIAGHGFSPKTMYLFNDTADSADGYTIRHPTTNADGTTENHAIGVADLYQNYSGVDPNTGSMDYFYCTRKIDLANNKMINTYSVSFGVGKIAGKTFNKIAISQNKNNPTSQQRNASPNSILPLTTEQTGILGDIGYPFMLDGDTNLYRYTTVNLDRTTFKLTFTVQKKDEAMQSNVWTDCGVYTVDLTEHYQDPSGYKPATDHYRRTKVAINTKTKQVVMLHFSGYASYTTDAFLIVTAPFSIPTSAGVEVKSTIGDLYNGNTVYYDELSMNVDPTTGNVFVFSRIYNYAWAINTTTGENIYHRLNLPFGSNDSIGNKSPLRNLIVLGDNKVRIIGTTDTNAKPVVAYSAIVDFVTGQIIYGDSFPINQWLTSQTLYVGSINERLFYVYYQHAHSYSNGAAWGEHKRTALYLNVPFTPELQFLCIDDVPAVTKESEQYIRIKYEIHSPLPVSDNAPLNAYFDSIPANSTRSNTGSLTGYALNQYKINPPVTLDIAQDDHEQVQILPIDQEL